MMRLLVVCILFAAASPAGATPVYRCGQTYSQDPCPGGHEVEATDPRTAAQRAEAKRQVARDQALATQMEQDRHAREANPPIAASLTVASAVTKSKPAKSHKAKKTPKKKRTPPHMPAASSP